MKHFFLFLTFCFSLVSFNSKSQGCSDPGICTVGALSISTFKFEILHSDKTTLTKVKIEDTQLKLNLKDRKKDIAVSSPGTGIEQKLDPNGTNTDTLQLITNRVPDQQLISDTGSTAITITSKYLNYYFQFSTSYGLGEQNTSIYTLQLEGGVKIIKNKLYAQLKLPYTFVSGKLASINGLSDITLSLSYIVFSKAQSNLNLTGGVKLPTNGANIYKDDLPLPMVYQTSLGSADVLIGAKYNLRKWDFTCGYQHAFNANKNKYLHSTVSDNITYNNYFQSREMKRADDGIFRVNRNFNIKKANTSAGLLFIYHLGNDDIIDALGNKVKAYGSKGLTLNLNFSGVVPLSEKLDLIFIFGAPLITRDYRTDGLTRHYIFITGIKFNLYKNNFSKA